MDGALATTATDSSPDLPTSSGWSISGRSGYMFSGMIDEVRLSNVALDPSEFLIELTNPPGTYTVGGSVSGLTGTGLVLQNSGGDDKTISADGSFTFDTPLADGLDYDVTVSTDPSGQTCSLTNESGTIAGANVTNVSVNCVDDVSPTVTVTSPADGDNYDEGDTISFTGSGSDIAVDSSGNVSVTGATWRGLDGNTSNGSLDIFIRSTIRTVATSGPYNLAPLAGSKVQA